MKRTPATVLAAFLLLALAAGSASSQTQGDEPVPMLPHPEAEVASLRASSAASTDTVYVGCSRSDHWNATNNWWNVWTGTRRPGVNDPANAIWDWENFGILASHGVNDSLAGWWPDLRLYTTTGGYTLPDAQRPWWALDNGNVANYVINQGPGGKRTYGVVGVWHADGGVLQPGGSAVQWAPLSGTRSAWCGLRQLGDLSAMDAMTGNPFNQSTVERMGGGGPFGGARRYPGYASQWDQMLYRDFEAPAGQPLTLSFLYRTRLSEGFVLAAATRTGWFHGDPLAVTAGNFISSSAAGANAPRDSFMVYVGVPVNETSCTYSDGSIAPVYDPQRRWFSEVLRLFDGSPCFEIFSAAGSQPADTAGATPLASVIVSAQQVDAIRAVSGGIVRLVFRVKTNRGSSDDDGFDSATRGAALLDDVTVNGVVVGDFELSEQGGPGAIDNRPGASPLNNWKSTGKPPSIHFHLGNLEGGINYSELCGAWDSPARVCDIRGNVMMAGNYDVFEALNDPRYLALREGFPGAWSPTINMTVARDGSNAVNPHGLRESIVSATDGIKLMFDVYAGQLNLPFTGVGYWPACQVWPVAQPNNGAKVWSDPLGTPFLVYNPDPQCYADWFDLGADIGFPPLANVYNAPDSLRVWLGIYQACFRFGVTLGCNDNDGVYFDNVSVAFVDWPANQASAGNWITPGAIRTYPWELPADVFPANETPGLPNSANFDTTTALIVGPRNIAQATGNQQRFCIQPDSVLVNAPDVSRWGNAALGNTIRLDLVFRILPGPGNYAIATPGGRTFPPTPSMGTHLLDVPANQADLVTPGDGSFWGEYIANRGTFGSPGAHVGGAWNYLTWNSARCDTAEANVFPVAGLIGTGLTSGLYANTLHEEDPKFATLGVTKFRCFVVDTAQAAENANIVCNGTVPSWLTAIPASRTGWDGSTTTKEHTKIIPDGLLTPGAHVQYFYRKSARADSLNAYVMVPDTNRTWQPDEGSVDAHRWQQFGVLPDRWKNVAFGGASMACMLYVDWNDRRGNERVFVSVMDSLGGTSPSKYGVHNGWHAPGLPGARLDDLAGYPTYGNQQPGTSWDMYGVRGAESGAAGAVSIGSRMANRTAMGLATGKYARTGPTPEMLRRFYRMLTIYTGDLNSGITGPFRDKSQDDIGMFNDFLVGNSTGSTAQPRGLYIGGDGFVQDEDLLNGQNASHNLFVSTKLGLTLRNASYQAVSNNTADCTDLITTDVITTNGDIHGVGNTCTYSNDLFNRNPAIAEAQEAMYYENVGVGGPYVAAVHKPTDPLRPWVAYTEGWNIEHLWSRWCAENWSCPPLSGNMVLAWDFYNKLFAAQCQVTTTSSRMWLYLCWPGDVPPSDGGARFTDFLKVGNSLVRSGTARIQFGVASPDRVRIRLYDVAGRVVRTLADRVFAAGEYDLPWDGADDGGARVAHGVYFVRVEFASRAFTGNGRVVLLK